MKRKRNRPIVLTAMMLTAFFLISIGNSISVSLAKSMEKSSYKTDIDVSRSSSLQDFYEFGADEMVVSKGTVSYVSVSGTVSGKTDVSCLLVSGWNGQIDAKSTSHLGDETPYSTANEAREGLIAAGYQYAAITVAFSDDAQIGCYTTLPVREGMAGELGGVILKAGTAMSYNANANILEEYRNRILVYADGEQISAGDIIKSGIWYTIVCTLQLNVNEALYGINSYVNVALTNGNNKAVYVSDVRYYTNDTYKRDYAHYIDPEINITSTIKYSQIDLLNYTTYYFDAQNGDDSNSGITENLPKSSLNQIAAIAATASVNNPVRILLKKGSIFNGNLVLSGYESTAEKPLIIDSYGEGDNYPKIIGFGSETNVAAVITVNDDNIRIYNLEITGPTAYQGIYVLPADGGVFENIIIEGCYIHDINFNWNYPTAPANTDPATIDVEDVCSQYKSDGSKYGRYVYRKYSAISFYNDVYSEPSWFENVWIAKNKIVNVGKIGINVYNLWNNQPGVGYGYNKYAGDSLENNNESLRLGRYPHKKIVCYDNYMECTGGDGLVLSGVEDGIIEKNISYYANYLGREGYWNVAIWVFGSRNVLMQYNEAAYTYLGGGDGQGFDIDNACSNIYFQYNYSHNNQGGGMLVCNVINSVALHDSNGVSIDTITQAGKWEHNYIRNNLFVNNGLPAIPTRSAFITVARQANDLYAYNNTVIMRSDITGQSIINTEDKNTTATCYRHQYYNNIFYSSNKSGAKFTISMMYDYIFYNNLYCNIDAAVAASVGDTSAITDINPNFSTVTNFNGWDSVNSFIPKNNLITKIGKEISGISVLRYDILKICTTDINYVGAFCRT